MRALLQLAQAYSLGFCDSGGGALGGQCCVGVLGGGGEVVGDEGPGEGGIVALAARGSLCRGRGRGGGDVEVEVEVEGGCVGWWGGVGRALEGL